MKDKNINKIPNQNMPASSMTKFEMAVFMVLQGIMANNASNVHRPDYNTEIAIKQTKETFKQLEDGK